MGLLKCLHLSLRSLRCHRSQQLFRMNLSLTQEPFPLKSSDPKVNFFSKIVTKIHPFFFFTSHNPTWERTGTSIWGMGGSPGVLPVIKPKVTKSWWLISTINQLDWTENPQESTPVCVKPPCAMRVISERLTSRGKTHHECQWHHPVVWVSSLNEKEYPAEHHNALLSASWLWMPRDHCFPTVDAVYPPFPDCGCHVTTASWLWMPPDHCLMLLQLCLPCPGGLFLQAMSPKRPFLPLLLLGNLVTIRRQKQLIHKSHTLPKQV